MNCNIHCQGIKNSEPSIVHESVRRSSLIFKENFLEPIRILLVEDNPVNVIVSLRYSHSPVLEFKQIVFSPRTRR